MKQTKEVVLGILVALFNLAVFWFWFKITPLIAGGEFQNYGSFIIPVGGLILAASFFLLSAIFVKNKWLVYGSILMGLGAPYLFIPAHSISILLFVASLALAVFAVYRVRGELNFSLNFSLFKTAKAGLPIYFTVASLIISVFYLTQIQNQEPISTLFPKPALNFALDKFSGPISSLTGLPAIKPEKRVDELLYDLLREQLKAQGVSEEKIPKKELEILLAGQRDQIAKQFGIRLNGQEKAVDAFYEIVTEKVKELLGPYQQYLPLVSALAFLLAFKTLTIPLYYVTIFLSFILIKLMLLIKILKSEKQQIEVERMTF